MRADSGFWSWELCDRLNHHRVDWSINVTNNTSIRKAIAAVGEDAWTDIGFTLGGQAQVAETVHLTGGRRTRCRKREIRLIVRRTRLTNPTQAALWPDWRHYAYITSDTAITAVEADVFHRHHALVELAIRDLKEGARLTHIPSGHYGANAAWLACTVLAHNLGIWAATLTSQPPATNRTRPAIRPPIPVTPDPRTADPG